MPNIRHELFIGVSAEKMYTAITSRDGLSAWWTPDTDAKHELYSVARFGFGPHYFKEMKIAELKPYERVVWDCIAGADEWVGTTISFTLQPGGKETILNSHPEIKDQVHQQRDGDNATVLIFDHYNWREYSSMFAECNYTWGRFLRSLKLFCETGRGLPWPNQHRIES